MLFEAPAPCFVPNRNVWPPESRRGPHRPAGVLAGGDDEVQPLQAGGGLGARLGALQLGGDAGGEPLQLLRLGLPAGVESR